MRLLCCVLLPGCLLALPAMAQPVQGEAQPGPVRLNYAAYSNGLNVVDLQATVALSPQAYRMQLSYHLTGVIGAFFHGEFSTTVDGRFQGNRAEPREMFSTGHMRGEMRVTQIDWRDGNPVVMQLVPPTEAERDPVPPEAQAHTIDGLSAMAALLHQVATTGRCEGGANTFDGRRLSLVEAHTVGEEMLEETSRSIFHGTALRCDFEGRQLAGFVRDQDQSALRRPQRGSAWFARLVPGQPPVPVRITFQTRGFGPATMYLTEAG